MKTKLRSNFVFFGTPELSVTILEELSSADFTPSLIVTQPDKPAGRGRTLTPPPVKVWAEANSIPVVQPAKLDTTFLDTLRKTESDFYVLAAYGKILPQTLIEIPLKGIVNVHPSLLPRLRGPSPIQSAILKDEKRTGVSIMLIDKEMDHGPIIAQKEVPLSEWPPYASELSHVLAREGGRLLAESLPPYLAGTLIPKEQEHARATYCTLLKKEDAFVSLQDDPYQNLLKIRGYEGWPVAYTFFERNGQKVRVQLLKAHQEGSELVIDTVRPEGKTAMLYEDFLRSGAKPIGA